MVLLTIVVTPIGDDFTGGAVLNAVMLALLVLTTLSRSHVSRGVRIFGAVVTLSAIVVAVAGAINGRSVSTGTTTPDPEWLYALGTAMYTMVLALCFPAILRQAFTHRRVSLNTVAASLSAYLLLGLQPTRRQQLHLRLLQLRHAHHGRLRRLHRGQQWRPRRGHPRGPVRPGVPRDHRRPRGLQPRARPRTGPARATDATRAPDAPGTQTAGH